jgi:hypothetical protein
MRKLRRLPWRIPKSHHSQPATNAPAEACSRAESENEARREAYREALTAQPVAFAGGRYVYGGDAPRRAASTPQIRRKARHRAILPVPMPG